MNEKILYRYIDADGNAIEEQTGVLGNWSMIPGQAVAVQAVNRPEADDQTRLLGKQVQALLRRAEENGGDARVVEGKLLGFGHDGTFVIEQHDGFVFYCWPMLEVEEVTA